MRNVEHQFVLWRVGYVMHGYGGFHHSEFGRMAAALAQLCEQCLTHLQARSSSCFMFNFFTSAGPFIVSRYMINLPPPNLISDSNGNLMPGILIIQTVRVYRSVLAFLGASFLTAGDMWRTNFIFDKSFDLCRFFHGKFHVSHTDSGSTQPIPQMTTPISGRTKDCRNCSDTFTTTKCVLGNIMTLTDLLDCQERFTALLL